VGRFVEHILYHDLNVIVNLRGLTFEEQRHFVRLFAEYLYRWNKEFGPRHLVIEEVQQFAPQQAKSEAKEILQVLSTMGRMEGIGLSVVTQRPAIVDKTVIANTDAFVFYQLMLPPDLGAVTEVLTAKTNMPKEEEAKINALVANMPSLTKGEVILYSPEWLQVAERARMDGKRFTPHTGATPDDYVRLLGDEDALLAQASRPAGLGAPSPGPVAAFPPPSVVPPPPLARSVAPSDLPRAAIPNEAMLGHPRAIAAGGAWKPALVAAAGFLALPAILIPLQLARSTTNTPSARSS
jgi:hypothetical protein